MDEFESKRGMIQVLMDMLKKSAGDEVGGAGGEGGEQLTHTPLPAGSVAEHPHKKDSYAPGEDGGMASPTDEPMREMPSDVAPAEGDEEEPTEDMGDESSGPMEDSNDDSSAFEAFVAKNKRK